MTHLKNRGKGHLFREGGGVILSFGRLEGQLFEGGSYFDERANLMIYGIKYFFQGATAVWCESIDR